MNRFWRAAGAIALGVTTVALQTPAAAQSDPASTAAQEADALDVGALSELTLLAPQRETRLAALAALLERGDRDIIPTLTMFLRLSRDGVAVAAALSELTGADINGWRDAMLWQEAHPEVVAHPSYRTLRLRFWRAIDENFDVFFEGDRLDRDKMKIRFEEVVWGGVMKDGIPSLDAPAMIAADDADYLLDDDLVFGVEINGDVRAYPLRIMGWHEMFNDVIGGVPVALAYCTLCGAGILFETQVDGREEPFVFGSSGFLYRSNKLMFDRETHSLWNQFTGEPVIGPLVDSGIALKIRPVAITSWGAWRARHPETAVLSLETGHIRDYGSGVVYRDYFASPDLMFPAVVRDESRLLRKDYVFGVRAFGAARAWPVDAFQERSVLNDRIGDETLVLIGDAETRTVRAYARADRVFEPADGPDVLREAGAERVWRVTEDALIGPDGARAPRVPGHIAYWFAWDGYLGVESTLYPD